jgi:hypothetical protein
MKKQLLCTFSNTDEFKNLIEEIKNFYSLNGNKLFLFVGAKAPKNIYITYNIDINDSDQFPKFPNTIGLHRKKQTNTLYTLNAMNKLIAEENSGVFDNKFQLNWELYSNSLILTGEVSVKIIPIKLFDIIS